MRRSWKCLRVAWLATGMACAGPELCTAQVAAPPAGADGGGNAPITAPPPSPDPTYARVIPPGEFTQSPLPVRRRIMSAWALGSPEGAGPAILPMLNAGLADADREVRAQALRVLDRVEFQAFSRRMAKQPVVTDPSVYGPLYTTLVRMLNDPEPGARAAAVAGLANLDSPPKERLDAALLERLPKETDAPVRARIIAGLTSRAGLGSAPALAAVLASFDDPSVDVRFRGVVAMQLLRHPDGLAKVVHELGAPQPHLRLAVVRALAAYGDAAAPHRAALEARLTEEKDASVRSELERVLKILPQSR